MREGGDMRRLIFAGLAAVMFGGGAQAQSYPSRPITIVVPFAAGGPTDAIARAISERMRVSLDWLKANSDKVATGTAGVGSASHFSGVYFQNLIKVPLNFVPYRGTGPALQDLVAGQIDMIVDQASNAMAQVQAGKIRAYAIADTKRLATAPGIPTAAEAGLAGFQISLWNGLWAPKGTPPDVIA